MINYLLILLILSVNFLSQSMAQEKSHPFFRILHQVKPKKASELRALEFQYGGKLLFVEDENQKFQMVEGVVFHALPYEKKYFVGTSNPVLEIENEAIKYASKVEEFKLLAEYAPDFFPITMSLDQVSFEGDLNKLKKILQEKFPKGFLLKPEFGYGSDGSFPSENTDFKRLYDKYLDKLKPKFDESLAKTGNLDETLQAMADHKGFMDGWVLDLAMKSPEQVLVQEKLNLKKSFKGMAEEYLSLPIEARVHVVGGKVLLGASSSRNGRELASALLASAEIVAQKLANRLPFTLIAAMDLMLTKENEWKVIELNTGGDSGFLHPDGNILATQLLSEFYTQDSTALLREYRSIFIEPDPVKKVKILKSILSRRELKELKEYIVDIGLLNIDLQIHLLQVLPKKSKARKSFKDLMNEYEIDLEVAKSLIDSECLKILSGTKTKFL